MLDAAATMRVTSVAGTDLTVDISGAPSRGGGGILGDAQLMRTYYEGWDDPNAYAVSYVGWGLNPGARWDSLTMYDKDGINGTETRAVAGSFLFSTGANEFADRFNSCHFDLPMRNCTVTIDDVTVIDGGRLVTSVTPRTTRDHWPSPISNDVDASLFYFRGRVSLG